MKPVTSVPHWDDGAADVDLTARSLCLIGLGPAAAAVVMRWRAEAQVPSVVLTCDELDPQLIGEFDEELAAAVVGWRLMLAGPEAAVAQLRVRAIDAGAEETEIRVCVTSSARRRTYCVHCTEISESEVAFGEAVRCPACVRLLRVRPHYSPRLAAYLGVADVS